MMPEHTWTMEDAQKARQMRDAGHTMREIEQAMRRTNKTIRAMIVAAGGEIGGSRPRRRHCPRCTALVAPGVDLCDDCIEELNTPMAELLRRCSPTEAIVRAWAQIDGRVVAGRDCA